MEQSALPDLSSLSRAEKEQLMGQMRTKVALASAKQLLKVYYGLFDFFHLIETVGQMLQKMRFKTWNRFG